MEMIIAICALFAKEKGRLKNNVVVTTVMSNKGFDFAMKKEGIKVLRTGVGIEMSLEK